MSDLLHYAMLLLASFGVFLTVRWGGRVRRANAVTAMETSLRAIEATLASAKEQLTHQQAETELARRRADEYFATIESVVKEATAAKQLYVRSGAEHGAAQSMMLREIDSLAGQYRVLATQYKTATGKAPPRPEPVLDRTLQVVAAEFRDEHVPAPAARSTAVSPSPTPNTA